MAAWVRVPCPGHTGEDCPQARRLGNGDVELRDSARPGEVTRFSPAGWAALEASIRAGSLFPAASGG